MFTLSCCWERVWLNLLLRSSHVKEKGSRPNFLDVFQSACLKTLAVIVKETLQAKNHLCMSSKKNSCHCDTLDRFFPDSSICFALSWRKKKFLWLQRLVCSKQVLRQSRLQLQGPVVLMFRTSSVTLLLACLHILIGEPLGSGLCLASAGLTVSLAQRPANALGTMPILIPEEFLVLWSSWPKNVMSKRPEAH